MNTFIDAIDNQEARTLNDMKARKSTMDANVDLFFKIGASRGKNIIPSFVAAFVENKEYAMRIVQWVRDIRGGAGERQLFKDILSYLEQTEPNLAIKLINKIPELGRWDDMLINYSNKNVEDYAFTLYKQAIKNENGLAAKWAPRKGLMAVKLRNFFKMTPKQYRKTLVNLTKVVETQMCKKEWDEIDFSAVPSLAHTRYKSAFQRNSVSYGKWVEALVKHEDPKVKINAGAVYPYDILKQVILNMFGGWQFKQFNISETERNVIIEQWNVLPNYVNDAKVLPMVDVSGSMFGLARDKNVSPILVAISLGLYFAEKNTGDFKDVFLTFSGDPELVKLNGDIVQKIEQMGTSKWGMNTNLHKAFDKVLEMAVSKNVKSEDMPKTIIIFSDMQFDNCVRFDDNALEMIERKYNDAGYEVPNIVFWNINSHDNVPVKFNQSKTALVSGFSPTIAKTILTNLEDLSPIKMMLNTILDKRYDY